MYSAPGSPEKTIHFNIDNDNIKNVLMEVKLAFATPGTDLNISDEEYNSLSNGVKKKIKPTLATGRSWQSTNYNTYYYYKK